MEDWDTVVVGAGPAGSAAAIAARRADPHARVLLLDAADFPRDKVCGDGVAPHALDVLTGLGVDATALVAGTRPVVRLRLESPGGATAAREFQRPAAVVPRAVFDDRLVQVAVDAGAVLRRCRVRTVTATADSVLVNGELRARTLIGADGAESVVRRQIGAAPARPGTVALAVRGYATLGSWPAGEQVLVLTRHHWPAYAWAFPIDDGQMNVGYGELLRGSPPTRAQLEQRMHALLPGLDSVELRGHRLPLSPGRPKLSLGRTLLVGDAASLINPLTGEGIYYAVLSGALAGAATTAADPATAYRDAVGRALGRHLRHTDVLARLVRWPALLDLGVEAASRDQDGFDELVEIGLGAGLVRRSLVTALGRAGLRHLARG